MSIETEQKIRDLLTQALESRDAQDVEGVVGDLRKALEQHILQARVSLSSQASLFEPDTPR